MDQDFKSITATFAKITSFTFTHLKESKRKILKPWFSLVSKNPQTLLLTGVLGCMADGTHRPRTRPHPRRLPRRDGLTGLVAVAHVGTTSRARRRRPVLVPVPTPASGGPRAHLRIGRATRQESCPPPTSWASHTLASHRCPICPGWENERGQREEDKMWGRKIWWWRYF